MSRPRLLLATGLLLFAPSLVQGQTRSEPRLLLSLFGGLSGGGRLWDIPRQSLLVLGTELAPKFDTLRLSRRLNTGFVLGISGTVFRSAHVGLSGEMMFLGLSTDDNCTLTYESPGADGLRRNAQLCGDIAARTATPTTLSLSLGATYRPLPRAAVSPYVKIQGGVGARSGSVIEVVGSFIEGGARVQRQVISDGSNTRVAPALGLGAGLSTALGPGYQVRLELRDQITLMSRVTGPADEFNGSLAPTRTFALHTVIFTAGLDIVLEQKRGRRY